MSGSTCLWSASWLPSERVFVSYRSTRSLSLNFEQLSFVGRDWWVPFQFVYFHVLINSGDLHGLAANTFDPTLRVCGFKSRQILKGISSLWFRVNAVRDRAIHLAYERAQKWLWSKTIYHSGEGLGRLVFGTERLGWSAGAMRWNKVMKHRSRSIVYDRTRPVLCDITRYRRTAETAPSPADGCLQ